MPRRVPAVQGADPFARQRTDHSSVTLGGTNCGFSRGDGAVSVSLEGGKTYHVQFPAPDSGFKAGNRVTPPKAR